MYMTITVEELRRIILGKQTYRKCPCCDNNGREYWDENGSCVSPFPWKEWGNNYESGYCANCGGLGYIKNT